MADTLAGHAEFVADFLECALFATGQTEAEGDDLALARIKDIKQVADFLAQILVAQCREGILGALIADQITERGVVIGTDLGVERRRADGDIFQMCHLGFGQTELLGQFVIARLATEFLGHLRGHATDLADFVDQVDRQADRFALVGQGALDRLLDPPGSVGAQLPAFHGIKAFDSLHQADVALGDEVQERQPVVAEIMGNLDHKAKIGCDHLFTGLFVAAFDLGRQLDLLFGGQERDLADLTQVESDIGVWSVHGGEFPVEVVVNESDHRFKQSFNLICFQLKMWGTEKTRDSSYRNIRPDRSQWMRPGGARLAQRAG